MPQVWVTYGNSRPKNLKYHHYMYEKKQKKDQKARTHIHWQVRYAGIEKRCNLITLTHTHKGSNWAYHFMHHMKLGILCTATMPWNSPKLPSIHYQEIKQASSFFVTRTKVILQYHSTTHSLDGTINIYIAAVQMHVVLGFDVHQEVPTLVV